MKMTMEQARNFSGQMLDNPKKFYAWYDKERARQIRILDSLSVDPEDDCEIDGDICREELLKFYATGD